MILSKQLEAFSASASRVIESTGAAAMPVVMKELTADQFGAYVLEQMSKAEADIEKDASTAAIRMQALKSAAAAAAAAFVDGAEKAWLPVVGEGSEAARAIADAQSAADSIVSKAGKSGDGADDGEGEGEGSSGADDDDGGDASDDEGGGEGDGLSKDDGDGDGGWSGSDINNDPELQRLIEP